jgi:chromosome segregation ATPase
MVVMTPRQTWTDKRLDEFKESVNRRFDEVDRRFDAVDKRLDRMDADIRELRQTVDLMNARMTTGFDRANTRMTTGFIGLAGLIVSSQAFF